MIFFKTRPPCVFFGIARLIYFQDLCGLPITTYFSAVKLRWLLDNCPKVAKAADEGRCLFGTVDSWLVWVSTLMRDVC